MALLKTPELPPIRPIGRKACLILASLCIASVGAYLLYSGITYRTGFPLDDAWIHQTYARNLALRGEWSFLPGKISGGSTAPLWSALLAIGFWLHLGPLAWAYLLGAAALLGLSVLGEKLALFLIPAYHPRFPWAGLSIALEWHLVWAAVSGMETLLYAFLATLILCLLIFGSKRYFILGLLIALSVWVRPDGITLLGPAILVALFSPVSGRPRLRLLMDLVLGFGCLFFFYLLFNLIITGSPWPNTFYAKQAEYAAILAQSFLERLGGELLQPLIGAGIILLAGFAATIVTAVKKRQWGVLAAALWLAGFLFLYAWKLPVTYQHGRYVIPAMPIFFMLGLVGLVQFAVKKGSHWRRLVVSFWEMTAAFILLIFWGRGGLAYAQDVAVIESEMVTTARWAAVNLPTDALLAAHDIGALGFFGEHDLVDLAGLISPTVIPFMRDETRLAAYLSAQHVDYLITFPDWYPQLTSGLTRVYSSSGTYAPSIGGTNMEIYRWQSP